MSQTFPSRQEPSRRDLLCAAAAGSLGLLAGGTTAAAAEPAWQLARFTAEVTCPVGHPLMGGGIAPAQQIDDPLSSDIYFSRSCCLNGKCYRICTSHAGGVSRVLRTYSVADSHPGLIGGVPRRRRLRRRAVRRVPARHSPNDRDGRSPHPARVPRPQP